jgi:ribonucleoside-diphosphate reductase alpha chain
LCTLGGIPWGKIKLEDMEHVCMAQLRILNSKLHIMKGSVIPHTDDSMRRMNVGIGAIDVFHMLAKEVFSKFPKEQWIQESARVTHTWMEHMQFYLLKAAVELAKQYGACEWFHKTKYSKGILPIDTYTKSKYVDFPLTRDWEGLRKDIIEYGMRFSLVTAHMPSESSSVVWGFLNSSEPPKAAVIVKGSKSTQVTMMCPDLHLYGDVYPYVWDDHPFDINDLYFSIAVNLAKFSDQGISYNTYINYQKTPRLDQKYLFKILFARPALCGIKTTYYVNNNVDSDNSDLVKQQVQVESQETEEQIDEDIDDGGCAGGFCTL